MPFFGALDFDPALPGHAKRSITFPPAPPNGFQHAPDNTVGEDVPELHA
jgi:hypothetical protein